MVAILVPATAMGQDEAYLELLRSDIATKKVAIFTEVLALSDAESEVFWPVYRNYTNELLAIGDKRVALIKDYAAHYDTLNNTQAEEMLKRSFAIADERAKLHKKYMGEFNKVLPATTVARFFQTERFLTNLIDLQISWELPLVETVREATMEDKSGSMGK